MANKIIYGVVPVSVASLFTLKVKSVPKLKEQTLPLKLCIVGL